MCVAATLNHSSINFGCCIKKVNFLPKTGEAVIDQQPYNQACTHIKYQSKDSQLISTNDLYQFVQNSLQNLFNVVGCQNYRQFFFYTATSPSCHYKTIQKLKKTTLPKVSSFFTVVGVDRGVPQLPHTQSVFVDYYLFNVVNC